MYTLSGTLDCFGKEITIYDADAFTKRFFLLNCNTSLTARQPPAVPHEPTPTLVVPPHDQGGGGHGVAAVGEPEDSLQNCLHLVAKAPRGPRQDLSRFMQYEGDILRFEAVMVSSEPTDSARRSAPAPHPAPPACYPLRRPPRRRVMAPA